MGRPCTLIVEDEASLRDDLVAFLEAKGYAAIGVGTAAEALRQIAANRFDLAVLDIGLPDGNGIDLLAEIRACYGLGCGVVVLTSHQDLENKIHALETGSDAYLVKHSSLREIECTLRNILRRLPEAVASDQKEWGLNHHGWSLIAPSGISVPLTSKEMTLLVMLVAAKGEICSHDKLALALGGGDVFSTGNLNTLVRRLRRKIEEMTNSDAPIRVAYGKGYAFAGPVAVMGEVNAAT